MKYCAFIGFDLEDDGSDQRPTLKFIAGAGNNCIFPKSAEEFKKLSRKKYDLIVTTDRISPSDIRGYTRDAVYCMCIQEGSLRGYDAAKEAQLYGLDHTFQMKFNFLIAKNTIQNEFERRDKGLGVNLTRLLTPTQLEIFSIIQDAREPISKIEIIEVLWAGKDRGLSSYISQINKRLQKTKLRILKYGPKHYRIDK